MKAERNEKGQIVLTLESNAEEKELWHRLNMPSHMFAKRYREDCGVLEGYDEAFDDFDMWNALDKVVYSDEEAKC